MKVEIVKEAAEFTMANGETIRIGFSRTGYSVIVRSEQSIMITPRDKRSCWISTMENVSEMLADGERAVAERKAGGNGNGGGT